MLNAMTDIASPNASVVSFRMKSRIRTISAASRPPTIAVATAATRIAGTNGQSKLAVSTAGANFSACGASVG